MVWPETALQMASWILQNGSPAVPDPGAIHVVASTKSIWATAAEVGTSRLREVIARSRGMPWARRDAQRKSR